VFRLFRTGTGLDGFGLGGLGGDNLTGLDILDGTRRNGLDALDGTRRTGLDALDGTRRTGLDALDGTRTGLAIFFDGRLGIDIFFVGRFGLGLEISQPLPLVHSQLRVVPQGSFFNSLHFTSFFGDDDKLLHPFPIVHVQLLATSHSFFLILQLMLINITNILLLSLTYCQIQFLVVFCTL
jgi:hypothetical protein